ncbi:MAG TPA: sigma factor-like helix-turn-helix DNA-binding protein [Labilithrix sp.]|nr:sigma factor-like helix-turn-helix DNA-binding protein [Labilithrix sp.]
MASRYRSLARNTREILDEVEEPPSTAKGAEEELIARDAQRLVLAAIQSIDLPRRAVFVMSEIDDVPMLDIATAMGIPLNTAYSRLRLAREEFSSAVRRLQAREAMP